MEKSCVQIASFLSCCSFFAKRFSSIMCLWAHKISFDLSNILLYLYHTLISCKCATVGDISKQRHRIHFRFVSMWIFDKTTYSFDYSILFSPNRNATRHVQHLVTIQLSVHTKDMYTARSSVGNVNECNRSHHHIVHNRTIYRDLSSI